ncbi:unnamed protein product [Durusdinium trenchii]|uniref:Uncharacterized protein n=1 Tax=Durusdinium trenchii TaxID=1381693 RepID=A0ABP0LLL7_9DINO
MQVLGRSQYMVGVLSQLSPRSPCPTPKSSPWSLASVRKQESWRFEDAQVRTGGWPTPFGLQLPGEAQQVEELQEEMFQRSEDKEQQPFAVFPPARDMPYTINNSHTTLTYNMLPFLCFQEPHDCGSLGFFLPPLVAPPTEVTGLRPPAGALVAEAGSSAIHRE